MELERPYYQDTGRRPALHYAIIGARGEELRVSRSRHHVQEMPEGLGIYGLRRPENSDRMDELLGGSLGKLLEERDPALYQRAKEAQSWMLLQGEVQKDDTLDYLSNAIGFVQAAVETGAVAVLDLQALELYSPEVWQEQVFSGSHHPYCHVYAMVSPEPEGTFWLHTRGMRKFGRPDIGMEGVPKKELERAMAVIDQMISHEARGAVFPPIVRLHLSAGRACTVFPRLAGDMEDCDYNNEHYHLRWEECEFEGENRSRNKKG